MNLNLEDNSIKNVHIKGSFIYFENMNHPKGFVNKTYFALEDVSMIILEDKGSIVNAIFAIDGSAKQIAGFETMESALDFCNFFNESMLSIYDIEVIEYFRNHDGKEHFKFINPFNVTTILETQARDFVTVIIGVKGLDPSNKRLGFFQNIIFDNKQICSDFINKIVHRD